MIAQSSRRTATKVRPHGFTADLDFPPDHRGRGRCVTCGLMGVQGDGHHPDNPPIPQARPLPPALAEAAHDRDAAILGEKDDEDRWASRSNLTR